MRERKPRRPHAEGLTLRDLREARGVSRPELAKSLGLKDDSLLAKYERGERPMSREVLDWAVSPLEPFAEEVSVLLFAHRLILADSPAEPGLSAGELRRIDGTALAVAWSTAQTVRGGLIRRKREEKAAAERRAAEGMLAHLLTVRPADRRDLVTVYPQLRSCALVALVCEASVRAASHRVSDAQELAELALFIAERVPGGEERRARARGYVYGFLSNVRRVGNDYNTADALFRRAWELWAAGAPADPDPLKEWRLLDLEASLRRAQHRFAEALDLLDRAQRAAGPDAVATGRILMMRSNIMEQKEDFAGALAALAKAAPVIESSGDQRLLFGLRFNQATNLCLLKRHAAAAELLEGVREMAVQQADELSLIRVLWLEARVAAGMGQGEKAMANLELVRGAFTAHPHPLPYDAALSSLDLAVLWLERGRAADVRELAVGMMWIFHAQGIDREALAALTVFCEAARRDAATVELTKQVIADIEKAHRSAPPRSPARPQSP
jgi:transcriptional regulator with XRE-family HTH domain